MKAGHTQEFQSRVDQLYQCIGGPSDGSEDSSHGRRRVDAQIAMAAARDADLAESPQFTEAEAHDLSTIREWIVDTGSGLHLMGKKSLAQEAVAGTLAIKPVKLTTANGVIHASEQLLARVTALGSDLPITITVLDDSPAVLSVGNLCEVMGWTFRWEGFQRPYLQTPDGSKRIYLYTRKHVPLLLNHLKEVNIQGAEDVQCFQSVSGHGAEASCHGRYWGFNSQRRHLCGTCGYPARGVFSFGGTKGHCAQRRCS